MTDNFNIKMIFIYFNIAVLGLFLIALLLCLMREIRLILEEFKKPPRPKKK